MARENKAADPTGKARKAAERLTLNQHVAASNPRNNPGPNTYQDRVKPVTDEVDAQIVKDRGAKHSRA